jgi:hypothetical protein
MEIVPAGTAEQDEPAQNNGLDGRREQTPRIQFQTMKDRFFKGCEYSPSLIAKPVLMPDLAPGNSGSGRKGSVSDNAKDAKDVSVHP